MPVFTVSASRMRFRLFPLMAAMLAAAGAGGAQAQDAGGSLLRGSVDDGGSQLLLTNVPVPEPAPVPASATGATEDTGRVARQTPMMPVPPVAKGPEPDTVDDTVTGSVPRRTIAPEDDPFTAVGIRAGGFILYPSQTTTIEHDTNASGDGPATTLTVTPELRLQSDWALHEATLTLRGSYETYLDGSQPDSPSATAEATGRIDLKPDWNIALDGKYDYSQQSISDPNFPAGVDNRPGVHDFSGSAALNGRFGRKMFTVEGTAARSLYENGISGSSVVDQSYRDNNVFGGRLRLGYETPLGLTPFVEGEVDRRRYDQPYDNNGLRRSSLATTGRAGIVFDRGPVLTGEMAVGYGAQTFDDPTLAALHALTLDGSLVWSPTRLYTVTIDAATAFNPSTDASSSGSVTHDASVDIAYAWKHNATVDWTASVNHEVFQGTGRVDTIIDAGVAATWKLNRRLYLSGGYVHEWRASTEASDAYQTDAVKVGLRLQR